MIFSKYTDLLPKEVLNEDAPGLQKPDEEAIQEVRARRPQNYFRFVTKCFSEVSMMSKKKMDNVLSQ